MAFFSASFSSSSSTPSFQSCECVFNARIVWARVADAGTSAFCRYVQCSVYGGHILMTKSYTILQPTRHHLLSNARMWITKRISYRQQTSFFHISHSECSVTVTPVYIGTWMVCDVKCVHSICQKVYKVRQCSVCSHRIANNKTSASIINFVQYFSLFVL